jgi:gluconokinase
MSNPSESDLFAALPPAILVMGVSASGKTTIGQGLASLISHDFIDGDDLHPPANVEKMRRSEPLTDDDRWPWLDRVAAVLKDGSAHPNGVVVACSALRHIYRDRIRRGATGRRLVFVFLDIPYAVAKARLEKRKGHFMPASLVDSQFATLERPAADETDVVTILEADEQSETIARAMNALQRMDREG